MRLKNPTRILQEAAEVAEVFFHFLFHPHLPFVSFECFVVKNPEPCPSPSNFVPIPGTKQIKYVDENLGVANVVLNAAELREIDAVLPAIATTRKPWRQ